MAENRGVWGIDIGQAGLKAIRLRYAEAAKQVVAVAFDYVPHAKILSQPDANPDELIGQALDTFLSRNQTQGDVIVMSVPGQTALARFIQLPPVDKSKVGEIVKYEARQQIPFALEEVIWDYQPLGGGVEESGFMLDAEVGLFAMKRDQVQQHLAPFLQRKMEVELIQIAPLALYNYLCHDQLGHDPENSSASDEDDGYSILVDMGADNTTLLVSNGRKIWIRNVPLGGNHFTRALTKEMKLTFAKAEHLKCNATKSPDPKAIFQALRPVFNDYSAQIQRSIGYFSSVNRDAKIKRILGMGNGFKLAGLQKFLQQNLQMEVDRADNFPGLVGDSVLNAPLFQENILSFAVPYGLALQGLKITRVHTSLLPPEITTARLIRKKKPWAVAAAAVLLLGLTTSTLGYSHVWSTVSTERFGAAEGEAKRIVEKKGRFQSDFDAAVGKNKSLKEEGEKLMGNSVGRMYWLEVYKDINECLPRDIGDEMDQDDPSKKNRIRVYSITAKPYEDVGEWFKLLTPQQKTFMRVDDNATPPTGKGYVFTLVGRHFHDDPNVSMQGPAYVVNTLLKNLQQWMVKQQDSPAAVPVRQLGITHATMPISYQKKVFFVPTSRRTSTLPGADPAMARMPMPQAPGIGGLRGQRPDSRRRNRRGTGMAEGMEPSGAHQNAHEGDLKIPQTDFVIQFVWKEVPENLRTPQEPPPANAQPGDPNAPVDPSAQPGQVMPGQQPLAGQPVPGQPVPGGQAMPGQPAVTGAQPGVPGAPAAGTGVPVNPGAGVPGGQPGEVPGAPAGTGVPPAPGTTVPPQGQLPVQPQGQPPAQAPGQGAPGTVPATPGTVPTPPVPAGGTAPPGAP